MRILTILLVASLAFVLFSGCIGSGEGNAVVEVVQDNSTQVEEDIIPPAPPLLWSVNECRQFGGAKVCLEDVSAEADANGAHYAMVSIAYSQSMGAEDKVAPGSQKTVNGITFSVIETNPGSSVSSPSARMNLSGSYATSSRTPRALRADSCIDHLSSRICLMDVSRESAGSGPSPALISIMDADNNRMEELKIAAGGYGLARIGGANVAIHVSDTAAGASTSKAWARVEVNETAEAPPDSIYSTIYKGSCKTGYGMKVCLSELRMNGSSSLIAAFDVFDSSGVLLSKKFLPENGSDSSVLTGRRIKIDTGEIGYGRSSDIGWAKGRILILTD